MRVLDELLHSYCDTNQTVHPWSTVDYCSVFPAVITLLLVPLAGQLHTYLVCTKLLWVALGSVVILRQWLQNRGQSY